MSSRIVYIGAPEADALQFETRVRRDFPEIDLFSTNDRNAVLNALSNTEVLIGHHFQFDDALLNSVPKLRWIQSLTTGTDAILKLSTLRSDVLITSTRGMHGPQMSELVFLHMLSLARNFPKILENQKQNIWERWPQALLFNKVVVIVGVGAISEALASRCKAFGMTVIGITSSERAVPGFDQILKREQLKIAAAVADFMVLVIPLTADTHNIIDSSILDAMKPDAYLINVARGGVLDEDALVSALRRKRLAGAALDVFKEQPLPAQSPLWQELNLTISPLLGGMSNIYLEQAYPIVRRNLELFLDNAFHEMINLVPH